MATYDYELLDVPPAQIAARIRSDPAAAAELSRDDLMAMLGWAQHEQDRVVYSRCYRQAHDLPALRAGDCDAVTWASDDPALEADDGIDEHLDPKNWTKHSLMQHLFSHDPGYYITAADTKAMYVDDHTRRHKMTTQVEDPQDAICPNCGCIALIQFHACDNLDACPVWVPSRGWVATADLTAADRAEIAAWQPPPLRYDPEHDQCPSGHAPGKRAGIVYYGTPLFMCPRCFENTFGGPPADEQMVTVGSGASVTTDRPPAA